MSSTVNNAAIVFAPVLKGCISDSEMRQIFSAKCKDFDIQESDKLFERFLNHQAKKPFMKVFDMPSCAFGRGSATVLANILIHKPLLKIINISGNSIGDRGARCFANLIVSSQTIISINLSSNQISDKGAETIFMSMCHNKHITYLNLGSDSGVGRNSFGAKACQAMKKMLMTNHVLSELDISMTEIAGDTINIISEGINGNTTLELFNISNNNIQSKGVISLLKACAKSKLKVLHLANNHIRDDATPAFSLFLSQSKSIETLDLSGNYLTKKFISGIVKQLKISSISTLTLNGNPLLGEGIAALGIALNGESNIKHLNFNNCQVDTNGFVEFCDLISSNASLVSLHMSHNSILDDGAGRLSHVIKRHPKLKDVDLEQCEITEEGGNLLFLAFAKSTSIRRINVKNNLIRNGVLVQKCLTENPRIFFLNADFNTMEYKTTVEIQRLVNENIKRWKSSQKSRVKQEVGKLAVVNDQLFDTRQSIVEEREYISILRKEVDEAYENEDLAKMSKDATNEELQNKLTDVNKIVDEYIEECHDKSNEVRTLVNQKDMEVSGLQHKLDTATQTLKTNCMALQNLEQRMYDSKKQQQFEREDLRIQMINAQMRYTDLRAVIEELWKKKMEQKREIRSAERKKRQEAEQAITDRLSSRMGPSTASNKDNKDNNSKDKENKSLLRRDKESTGKTGRSIETVMSAASNFLDTERSKNEISAYSTQDTLQQVSSNDLPAEEHVKKRKPSPKRSKSVQIKSKKPRIVVPVANNQKKKKNQNQQRPHVAFQSQIIP